MKFKKATILVLLVPFFLFANGQIVEGHGANLNLPKTIINPGSFYYPFKRIVEKAREKILFSDSGKVSFYSSTLKTRLVELDYVTGKKALSEVENSSKRFAATAGVLTDAVLKMGQSGRENLVKQFAEYSDFLAEARDRFPANSSFWLLIQHDINTLNILSEHLK